MTSQELLRALLTAIDTPYSISFGQDKVDLWPHDLREALLVSQVLRRDLNSDCIDCGSCGSVHAVYRSIPRVGHATCYLYDCPYDGKQIVDAAELYTWTLHCAALANWLAQQLPAGCLAEEISSERLWRLGKLDKVAIYLISGLSHDGLDDLLAQLPRHSFVISLSVLSPAVHKEQLRFIDCASVVSIENSTLRLDTDQLKTFLIDVRPESVSSSDIDKRFSHSDDFRNVRLDDNSWTLSPSQARVVEALYNSAKNGLPELSQEHLLVEVLDTSQKRLQSIFKSHDNWQQLIAIGKGRGMYRLNL